MFTKSLLFAFAATFSIVATAAHADDAATAQCTLKQLASLPITETANGMISVPVKVNDSEQQFVVALGEPYTAVAPEVVNDQQLIVRSIGSLWHLTIFTYMGSTSNVISYLPKFGAGNTSVSNFQALVLHVAPAPGTSGVIGDDFLSNFDVELNLKSRKLNLFSPAHCPGNVVYWGRSYVVLPMSFDSAGAPEFNVQLDGKPVSAEFKPINPNAIMDGGSAKNLFGIIPPVLPPAKRQRLIDAVEQGPLPRDPVSLVLHTFSELTLDGVKIKNLKVVITPDTGAASCQGDRKLAGGGLAETCTGGHDLSLGRSELSQLRLYFAFKEKNLYITGADPDPTASTSAAH